MGRTRSVPGERPVRYPGNTYNAVVPGETRRKDVPDGRPILENTGEKPEEERAHAVVGLKPHISREEAIQAVKVVDKWLKEAERFKTENDEE